MQRSSPISAPFIVRGNSTREDPCSLMTETDQHALSRLFRYRLAVLEAALRRVEELRRQAAKANLRLRYWIVDQIIQDVPSDIEVCEFDCSKGQCTLGEWRACKNRSVRPCSPSIH